MMKEKYIIETSSEAYDSRELDQLLICPVNIWNFDGKYQIMARESVNITHYIKSNVSNDLPETFIKAAVIKWVIV